MQTATRDTPAEAVGGRSAGRPGGAPLGESAAVLRSASSSALSEDLKPRLRPRLGAGHGPRRAARDPLWEGIFSFLGCSFYSVLTSCFQTASQVFANT